MDAVKFLAVVLVLLGSYSTAVTLSRFGAGSWRFWVSVLLAAMGVLLPILQNVHGRNRAKQECEEELRQREEAEKRREESAAAPGQEEQNGKQELQRQEGKAQADGKRKLSLEELIGGVTAFLVEKIPENVPETGPFELVGIRMPIPGSTHMAAITYECDEADKSMRRLTVVVIEDGTDRAYHHVYAPMSQPETLRYLASDGAREEICRSVKELARRAGT